MNPRDPQAPDAEDQIGRPSIYEPLPIGRLIISGEDVWSTVVGDSALIFAPDGSFPAGDDLA